MTIRDALALLMNGQGLLEDDAEAVMEQIMTGQATPAQIAGFLVALRIKGETVGELTGFARAMRKNAIPVRTHRPVVVDVCGTGGDGRGTFNISTAVSFVIAGAGLAVAKHGNRSVSSRCGSADVLEALGVGLELSPEAIGACIDGLGIGFLYAPLLHPAMKHAIGPRCEMGVRTVFNILGPLTNPAGVHAQVLGVYEEALTEPLAEVLRSLGCQAAFVVHGGGGLDELSTLGPNRVTRLKDGQIRTFSLDPQRLGLVKATLSDLRGGDAEENAAIITAILDGKPGPKRDIVLLNAACGLVAGGLALNLAEGLSLAAESIDTGAAQAALTGLIAFTQQRRETP